MIQTNPYLSNTTKEDSRIIRSKRDLANALQQLLQEKNYDGISIKDITDLAMVSKNTFYNNFNEKNDLLRFLFKRYEDELMKDIKPLLDKVRHSTRHIFFNKCIEIVVHFFYTGQLPFKKMIQQDQSHSLYYELNLFLKDLFFRLDTQYNRILSNKLNPKVLTIFYSGAFSSMIYFSVKDDIEIEEKDLIKTIKIMAFPAVE